MTSFREYFETKVMINIYYKISELFGKQYYNTETITKTNLVFGHIYFCNW